MDLKIVLGTIAALLAFFSSYLYILDIFRGNTKPHTYTWLIWAIVTMIAFLGQWVSGGGPGSWATGVSALLTTFILLLSLKGGYGTKDITNFDKVCLALALIAILPWLLAKSVLWSVILATAIDLIAFFPTMRKTWHAPRSESLGSMYVDSVKHSLSMFSMNSYSLINLIYPASVLLTKFIIIVEIVYLRAIRKTR
ncbi:MAG: rane protein [Candidatus Kaiserbacteria bacterium]|nr:rane protein [Candidatus Kaiserbacteria bacterium]